MKFDMGEAWNEATAMLAGNRDLVLVVAGVFFFLPYLALVLMTPDFASELPAGYGQPGAPPPDPQVLFDQIMAIYAQIWPYMLALAILQAIGSLALLSLLRDSTRPTLGEALKLGAIAFLPYIAAQLLVGIGIGLVFMILVGGGGALSPAVGVLMMFVVLVLALYVATKCSLAMPVIAIERVYNPIAALGRSWKLTKSNSLRLFIFYFLIVVAGMIVVMVLEMILGLLFALLGEQGKLIADGILASALNAGLVVLLLAVVAAAHRQLAGGGGAAKAPDIPNG